MSPAFPSTKARSGFARSQECEEAASSSFGGKPNADAPQLEAAMRLVADMFSDGRGSEDTREEVVGLSDADVGPDQAWYNAAEYAIAMMSGEMSPPPRDADNIDQGTDSGTPLLRSRKTIRTQSPPPATPSRPSHANVSESVYRSPSRSKADRSPSRSKADQSVGLLPPRDSPPLPSRLLGGDPPTPATANRLLRGDPPTPTPANRLLRGESPAPAAANRLRGESPMLAAANPLLRGESPAPTQNNRLLRGEAATPTPANRLLRGESPAPTPSNRLLRGESPAPTTAGAGGVTRDAHSSTLTPDFEAEVSRLFPITMVSLQQPPPPARESWCWSTPAAATPQRTVQQATPQRAAPEVAPRPRHASPRHTRPRSPSPADDGLSRSMCWQSTGLEACEERSVVEETFMAFCGAHSSMDGRSFAKLCRDCHLIDKRFTTTDADIVFAKVVPSGVRRMGLNQFEMALHLIADRKVVEHSNVQRAVTRVKGPSLQATKADAVRFHDDRSTYTGTHVYGGPEPAAKGSGHVAWKEQSLPPSEPPRSWMPSPPAQLSWAPSPMSSPDARLAGTPQAFAASTWAKSSPRVAARSESPVPASPKLDAARSLLRPPSPPPGGGASLLDAADSVENTFRAFCGARPDMDGRSFSKLCRDCLLIDKKFTATDADLIFAKVVTSGQRRIDFPRFEDALWLIGEKKAVDESAVRHSVARSVGPTMHATKTDAVRFHDDRRTYTGTHLYGPISALGSA